MWMLVSFAVITAFFFHIKRVQDYPDVCTVLQRKLKAISWQDGMNYIVYM